MPFRKATPDDNKSSVVLFNPTQQIALKPHEGFWFYRDLVRTESDVEAPVVFVGYGITAPELNYDDYAGIDGRGKIVAFINNAPATFPTSPAAYYANHVQKMSAAVDHGAIGFLMIRLPGDDSDPAGTGEWLKSDGSPQDTFPQIRAWAELTQAAAEILMQGSPKSLPQVLAAARAGEHQSFPLAWSARMHSVNVHQRLEASNVVGKIVGSDPKLRDEFVIYSAHLDHMGACTPAEAASGTCFCYPAEGNPDIVCHGALDNASGVAAVLEVARAFTNLPTAPRRSILFLFTTGEEDNFEGADYFVHSPTIPSMRMVADVNIDVLAGMRYPCKDFIVVGGEHSSLLHNAEFAVHRFGYEVNLDPFPLRNYFSRNDGYAFALQGIPAIFLRNGKDGDEVLAKWTASIYHTPLDSMDQPINWEAGLKAIKVNFLIGYDVAQQDDAPTWNKGNFFASLSDSRSSRQKNTRTATGRTAREH